MTSALEDLARIAEVEFADIVDSTQMMETKMRIMLVEGGFVDVWLSRKLEGRFGFHWEYKAAGQSYRCDNFPNTSWKRLSTYPYHFHNGSQDNVIDSSYFERDIMQARKTLMTLDS